MLGLSYLTAAVFRKNAQTVSNDAVSTSGGSLVCVSVWLIKRVCFLHDKLSRVCVRVRVGYTRALQCVCVIRV